jgi:hypothetical protein
VQSLESQLDTLLLNRNDAARDGAGTGAAAYYDRGRGR